MISDRPRVSEIAGEPEPLIQSIRDERCRLRDRAVQALRGRPEMRNAELARMLGINPVKLATVLKSFPRYFQLEWDQTRISVVYLHPHLVTP